MDELTTHTAIRRIGAGFFEQYNLDMRITVVRDGALVARNFNANFPTYQDAVAERDAIIARYENRGLNNGNPT